MKHQKKGILLAATLTTLSAFGSASAGEIFFAFPNNQNAGDADLFLTSGVAASGTIRNADSSFNTPFNIAPNSTTIVTIPSMYRLTGAGGVVSNNGFIIDSNDPIAAYFLSVNTPVASNDITNLFPKQGLGTTHRLMAGESQIVSAPSQLTIVASEDNTTVTVTPTTALQSGQAAGVPFDVTLNKGQSVLYNSPNGGSFDLTGTLVNSDKPIAVFGGHQCGNVPPSTVFCDFLIEQTPSTDRWGNQFVVLPTERPMTAGDALKIIADQDGTVVTLTDSGGSTNVNLNAGDVFELNAPGDFVDELTSISSNKPILVGQFMTGTGAQPQDFGDPAFSLIPDINQWLDEYIFNVPVNYVQDYLGIAIDDADLMSLLLDGIALTPAELALFDPVPGTTLVAGNLLVAAGSHTITADSSFMLTGHGFDNRRASYFGIGGSRTSGGGVQPPPPPPPAGVPEPATVLLLCIGVLMIVLASIRRRAASA